MKPGITALSIFIIIAAADLASYRALRFLPSVSNALWFPYAYFGLTALFLVGVMAIAISLGKMNDPAVFRKILWFLGLFLMIYLPKLLIGLSSMFEWIAWLLSGLFSGGDKAHFPGIIIAGTGLALVLFAFFAEGLLIGRSHLKVNTITLHSERLPESFNGLRIIQLSDIHLGGFRPGSPYLEKVVSRVNSLEPDLILFTGDLVNNFATEAEPFTAVLSGLRAGTGKYAVLGNHDYGKYYRWPSPEAEKENLEAVKEAVRSSCFELLLNENVILSRGNDSICLAGVENWGKPPFPQLGDLEKALNGEDFFSYTILMSHDPSHWEAEVLPQSETDLTLSGHTHAMQIGIELGKFRWSPSGWMYPQWGGLYERNGRFLYVNRGIGFTGFPGRVGERPEITLIILESTATKKTPS